MSKPRQPDLIPPLDVAWRIFLIVINLVARVLTLTLSLAGDFLLVLARDVLKPMARSLEYGRKELHKLRPARPNVLTFPERSRRIQERS